MRHSADTNGRCILAQTALLAGLILALAVPASAEVKTWDNGGSGDYWTTDGNWDPDGEPDLTQDDVVFPAGGWTVDLGSNVNLDSDAGRTWTLNSDVLFDCRHSNSIKFDDAGQLLGSGQFGWRFSTYKADLTISAAQSSFTGGFELSNSNRRTAKLTASAADAMGTGAASGTGYSQFNYTWTAQSIVGGVATAGITVGGNAVIDLEGTVADPSTLRERFTVNNAGILVGDATQFGYLTRVSSFSGSPTGAEVILADNAVVVPTDYDATPDISGLGTATDLFYGIAGTLNDAGFTLNVGDGTPWKGLSNDANRNITGTGDIKDTFKQGTIVIDDGGGTFTELLMRAPGTDYGKDPARLYIGDGSSAPTFQSAGGSDPVGLRSTVGEFWLNSPNVDFSGIDAWTFEDDAALLLKEALPGDAGNLDDLLDLVLEAGAVVHTDDPHKGDWTGSTTYVRTLTLGGTTYTSGTYTNTTDPDYIKGTGSIIVVPEPATLALIGIGGGAVLLRRRKR